MDFDRVAIIGTDCISVSIALGLKAQSEPPMIVGYDPKPVTSKLARSRGAFDRVERRPGRACRDVDLVVVAAPLASIRETLAAIAPHLRPGCLVTDTARLKTPVMRWAEELLPKDVHFVGGHPVPNPAVVGSMSLEGPEAASPDLLREALYCLTTSPGSSSAVVDAFAGLITALGAHPFFIDVTEHDGLQSGVEGLPDLMAVALLRATADTPGWREMCKFADYPFAATTATADAAGERHTAVFLNREHVLRRLNVLVSELMHLRDLLTQDDAEGLEEAFTAAAAGRARWIEERQQGMWVRERATSLEDVPSVGDQFRRMILGDLLSERLQDKSDHPRKE